MFDDLSAFVDAVFQGLQSLYRVYSLIWCLGPMAVP